MKTFLLFCLSVVVLVLAYKHFLKSDIVGRNEEETITYPYETTLTDRKGRVIQVTVEGKDDTSIYFLRNQGGRSYTFPVADLSRKDVTRVKQWPLGIVKKEDPMVKLKRERIASFEDEIKDLKVKAKQHDEDSIPYEACIKRIERLKENIAEIELEISKLEANAD